MAVVSFPFGIKQSSPTSIFAVLDKSFLDAVTIERLQQYVTNGWTFGVPPALTSELLRKRDKWRIKDLLKLHTIDAHLVILPGIGEMFRAEGRAGHPAPSVLRGKLVTVVTVKGPSGEYFELSGDELRSIQEREAELIERIPNLVGFWNEMRSMPVLRNASRKEMPEKIQELRLQLRDDREDIRRFYANHRHPNWPSSEVVDEKWAVFRLNQVHLLAGLDYIERHSEHENLKQEDLLHEMFDLDYLTTGLLVGGLATCDKDQIKRFTFLHPGGVLLNLPTIDNNSIRSVDRQLK